MHMIVKLKKIDIEFGVYPLCICIFYIGIAYSDSWETSIQGDVFQLEYNQELIWTNDTLPIVPTLCDHIVDVCDGGNYLLIKNKSHK